MCLCLCHVPEQYGRYCHIWQLLSGPVLGDATAEAIVAKAAENYDGIDELEIGRQVLTNDDVAERTHATGGNITHVDIVDGTDRPDASRPRARLDTGRRSTGSS